MSGVIAFLAGFFVTLVISNVSNVRLRIALIMVLVGIIGVLSAGPAKSETEYNILEINSPYEYGWWVGNIECLTQDEEMLSSSDAYYTDSDDGSMEFTEVDRMDFRKGRIDGCAQGMHENAVLLNEMRNRGL